MKMNISINRLVRLGYLFPGASLLLLILYELAFGGLRLLPFILYLGVIVYQGIIAFIYPQRKLDAALIAITCCILGPIYFLFQSILEAAFNVEGNTLVSLAIIAVISGALFIALGLNKRRKRTPPTSLMKSTEKRNSDKLQYSYRISRPKNSINLETQEGIPYLPDIREAIDDMGQASVFVRKALRFQRQSDNVRGEPQVGWIGGLPKLDDNQPWPKRADDASMHHLVTIDCQRIAELHILPLPRSGTLSFFAGPVPTDDGAAVIYSEQGRVRAEPNDLLPWDLDWSRRVPDEIKHEIPASMRRNFLLLREDLVAYPIEDYSAPEDEELNASQSWSNKTEILKDCPKALEERFAAFFPDNQTKIAERQAQLLSAHKALVPEDYQRLTEELGPLTMKDLSQQGLACFVTRFASKLLSDYPHSLSGSLSKDDIQDIEARNNLLREIFKLHQITLELDSHDREGLAAICMKLVAMIDGPLPKPRYSYYWDHMFRQAACDELQMASINGTLDQLNEKLALYLPGEIQKGVKNHIQVGGFGLDIQLQAASRREPIMLLQIEEFISMGILQYWISHDDLSSRRFDKVYCTNDCT